MINAPFRVGLRPLLILLSVTGVFGGSLAASIPAGAYGGNGQMSVYQVGLSFNCDNPQLCVDQTGQPSTGGFWGWLEFDNASADGQGGHGGDGQLTGCSHGGGFNGAAHSVLDISSWHIAPDAQNGGLPTFFASGVETDSFRGQTRTFAFPDQSTGVPAFSVHRPLEQLFGIPTPPGTSFNVQVAYKPAT